MKCWLQKKIFGPLTWAAKSPLASKGTRFAAWPVWFGGSVMDCAAEFVTHLSVYHIWDPVDFPNIVTERHSDLRSTSIRGSSMPPPLPLVGRCQGVPKCFTNVERTLGAGAAQKMEPQVGNSMAMRIVPTGLSGARNLVGPVGLASSPTSRLWVTLDFLRVVLRIWFQVKALSGVWCWQEKLWVP